MSYSANMRLCADICRPITDDLTRDRRSTFTSHPSWWLCRTPGTLDAEACATKGFEVVKRLSTFTMHPQRCACDHP